MVVYSEHEVELMVSAYRRALLDLEAEKEWWKVVAHVAAMHTPNKVVEVRTDLGEYMRGKAEFRVGYDGKTHSVIYKPKPILTDEVKGDETITKEETDGTYCTA